MQSGRLILAALLRRGEATSVATATEQCWALIRAASSLPHAAAAATRAAAPRWAVTAAAGHLRSFTTSAVQTAAAATAAAPAAGQPPAGQPPAETGTSQAAETSQQEQEQTQQQQQPQQPQTWTPKQASAPKVSFAELQEQYQQQLSMKYIRDEANLLLLFSKAHTPEQVTAALDLLRWDKMVRARQQMRYNVFSPRAMRSLLKAGRQARMGPSFAVQLLREADELGMQVSLLGCEDVLDLCISKQDYWAAAEAWVYTRVYCADPSRRQQQQQQQADAGQEAAGHEAAGHEAAGQTQQQQQQPQRQGPLGWASNSLMRLYAKGLAGWLRQGCVSPEHESYVKGQLTQLLQELEARGTGAPEKVKAALLTEANTPTVAAAAAVAEEEATEEAAGQPAEDPKPE